MKAWLFTVLLFSIVFISASKTAVAQDSSRINPPKKQYGFLERIDVGGYVGAQFGTITMINVSPILSFRVTPKFHTGIGGTYQYYKDTRYYPDYSSSAYGANVFTRYFIWRDLFAHLEYAPLYVNYYDYYYDSSGNYSHRVKAGTWVHDLMIGGGYRQWIGGKAFVSLMILWNVNESYYSPYRNPIFRIGFGVGL